MIAIFLSTVIAYILYTFVRTIFRQKRLQDQGVYFRGSPLYCFFNDLKLLIKAFDNEGAMDSLALIDQVHPGPNKPHFIGINTMNDVILYCLDPHVV